MSFKSLTLAALLLSAASLASAADTFNIDSSHSEAAFKVRHWMSRVSGKFADVSGVVNIDRSKPTASSVDLTIKATSIDTGVAKRDGHLRTADFFDVEKFPDITFKSTKIAPSAKKDVFDVTGDFTMHGVTKQITVPVEVLGWQSGAQGERVGFGFSMKLNRKDYGVTWNRTLDTNVMLGEDIDIDVSIEAVKKKEAPADAVPAPKQ
ncbi:MAG: YceI family protein [Acidobacteriota bacterium]